MPEEAFESVLSAAQRGAGWAFERLYRQYSPRVVGYLRAQGAEDPEDVCSEVFLGMFRRLATFSGDADAFRSWLFTIAHHRLIDDRRRQARQPPQRAISDLPAEPFGGDVEAEALAGVNAERIRGLLEHLSSDQRDVLLLRLVADLPVDRVAEIIDKPPSAVKALQRRGLASLRRLMEREGVSR